MHFGSDNQAGAAPEIVEAIVRANRGSVAAYGADDLTKRVAARFSDIFEREVAAFFVATGGAANGLALSAACPPYGMIFCHEDAHIQMDECGGPELFTGGAKLVPLKGFAGLLSAETLQRALKGYPERHPHGMPAKVLSLTQASECGAVYSPAALASVCALAEENGLFVHVDGARFANALVALNCSPADLTWKAGVDVLCFGGTKNGCIAAEAVIFFDKEKAADFELRRKRAGHLWSKQRFLAAQFDAYLEGDLWMRLARHANAMARRLAEGLRAVAGVDIVFPVDANEIFAVFPAGVAERLLSQGAVFSAWATPSDPTDGRMHRLVCSFQTEAAEVDRFLALLRAMSP